MSSKSLSELALLEDLRTLSYKDGRLHVETIQGSKIEVRMTSEEWERLEQEVLNYMKKKGMKIIKHEGN